MVGEPLQPHSYHGGGSVIAVAIILTGYLFNGIL
jgi:hypothetical protein